MRKIEILLLAAITYLLYALTACGGKSRLETDAAETASAGSAGGSDAVSVTASSSSAGGSGGGGAPQEAPFTLTPGTMPVTQIIVQTPEANDLAQYSYTVDTDGVAPIIASACVAQDDPEGDMADVDSFVLTTPQGSDFVSTAQATIMGNIACFIFATEQVSLTPGSTGELTLAAHVAQPISSAAAGNAWHGVPRSGHTPRFRLVSVTTKGGQQIELAVHETPQFVLRKAEPVIQLLPGDPLQDGVIALGRMIVSAPNGPVALRQFNVELVADKYFQTDWSLTVPAVLMNGQPITTNGTYNWCSIGEHVGPGINKEVWFGSCFDDDLVIPTGTSVTFTFQAQVSKTQPNTSFDLHMANREKFGKMDDSVVGTWSLLAGAVSYQYSPTETSYFFWSDLSEVPHGSATPTSPDYTNMFLVKGASSQALWTD